MKKRINYTPELFKEKAAIVHNNQYDYSKVEYKRLILPVTVICPEHGEFSIRPDHHLSGYGCPKCRENFKRLDNESFKEEANKVHNYKYDYSKTKFKNLTTPIIVTCPEHGDFEQLAYLHLKGNGCPKCAYKNAGQYHKMTKSRFVERIDNIYNHKFDLSQIKYKDYYTKVSDVICPTHGKFSVQPIKFVKGCDCPDCKKDKINEENKLKFIEDANNIYNFYYDYSKVDYKGSGTKVCIICPEHGEFWKTPANHVNKKQGCPKCSIEAAADRLKKYTDETFKEEANKVHNNKYDYSKSKYVNINTPLIITCPVHGDFEQSPAVHLKGCGCPNCNGIRKHYKFNLLKEFESEYEFKAFLENNDPNILLAILNNICETDPKFNPIQKDLEKALENSEKEDPISKLEEKYSSNVDNEEIEADENTTPIKIDLNNEEQFDEIFGKLDKADKENEMTIEDAIKNTEKEIKIIAKVENLIAPELRKKIMKKLLNDKLRQFMELNS